MKVKLDDVFAALPPATLPILEALQDAADAEEVTLYLVGGPVRDVLLSRPVVDVDLILEPHGDVGAEKIARRAAPEGARVRAHDKFGTVAVSTPEATVDVATVRSETYRQPGALPTVAPGTLEEDLARRDFSVNAMAIPLRRRGRRRQVELIDPHEGQRDLADKKLRVLHRRSFHDDPTRALRAARLAPRLGFGLARGALVSLHDALRDGAFGAVSGDRYRREFEKLFADAARGLDPAIALRRLADWHVLGALEPGMDFPREAVAPVRRLGRSLATPPWRGPRFRPWAAGLAVWLAPLGPAPRRRVLERLSVRGDLLDRLARFPALRDATLGPLTEARGRGAVDAILGRLEEEELFALHAWAPTPARRRIVRFAAEDRGRRSPVDGNALVGLGLSGPAMGKTLARIRQAFLDGEVANREEALALAAEMARQPTTPRRRRKPSQGR